MTLSKSLYTKSIQCLKALWLKKYKTSVRTPPDEQAQAILKLFLNCQYFLSVEWMMSLEFKFGCDRLLSYQNLLDINFKRSQGKNTKYYLP